MDWDVQTLNAMLTDHSAKANCQLMETFRQMTESPNWWKECAQLLINETHNLTGQAVFFFLRVIEHFVATRYSQASDEERTWLRKFFGTWLGRNLQQPCFVRNKTAQLLALICVNDCPTGQWPSFFDDLINFASSYGNDHPQALDMVLRVMKSLDAEVADRDIAHSAERIEQNTRVKDWMRDHCVGRLAAWWLHIMDNFKDRGEQGDLVCFCLEVVSLYVSWVDISLIANDAYMALFLHLLRPQPGLCRDAVCDCLSAVVAKGMPAPAKVRLVQQLSEQLYRAGVFEVIGPPGAGLSNAGSCEDAEYLTKLSSLVNQMGLQVLDAYNSFVKAEAMEEAAAALNVFETKVDMAMNLLASVDADVSRGVAPLLQGYLSMLKPLAQQGLSDTTKVRIETMLRTLMVRLKFDDVYDFDNEGEEEAIFQDYRRTLRVLLANLTQLAPELVLSQTRSVLEHTLAQWRLAAWNEVEVALALFFQLGEAMSVSTMSLAASPQRPTTSGVTIMASSSTRKRAPPNPANVHQAEAVREMLMLMCQSGVVEHSHPAVVQQYFETVSRYERVYFSVDKALLKNTMLEFLGEQGLRSKNERMRVRCAYLFSRFVRTHKSILEDVVFANDLLMKVQPLLVLPAIPDRASANSPCSSVDSDSCGSSAGSSMMDQTNQTALSEQGYLFETASFVVVACPVPADRKAELVSLMLSPIVHQVPRLSQAILTDAAKGERASPRLQMIMADTIRTCMEYACRSSKAFTTNSTMEQCGCVGIYSESLRVFIETLSSLPVALGRPRVPVAAGLRVYLHRLVVCLGEEVLNHFGAAARQLLATAGVRELSDFLPLLNQLMTKYKYRVHQTMSELLGVLIARVLVCLAEDPGAAAATEDLAGGPDMQALEEHRRLRRTFFLFFATVLQSQPAELLLNLDPGLQQQLLAYIVSGSMDVTDPATQKAAFAALRQLVLVMPDGEAYRVFVLQQVMPACLVAPARPEFDLRDAQTVLVLHENATCQKAVLEKCGEAVLRYLSSEALPNLNVPPPVAAEYVQALKNWNLKQFQQFLKKFYTEARHQPQQQSTQDLSSLLPCAPGPS